MLQKEVRELRDANQALTLYISKIIDRIIAKEGYENILAVEGEGKRPSRGTTRSKARARPSILPTRSTPEPSSNGKQDADGDDSITSQPAPADDVKAGRRQSIGLLGFGRSSAASPEAGNSTSPAAQGAPPKARRTASIDWRSLLGGSPQPEKEQSNPNLRPLALQGTSPMLGLGPSSARKVETAEDEEDAREIERIRASLQLQGITPPEHQLRPGPLSPSGSSSASGSSRLPFSTFFQRVTSGGSATSVGDSKSDFQERLTTFDDPSPARRPTPSVEARATLAQLEQREKAQAAALAAGGGSGLTEYVKPSRPVRERSGSTRSSISRGSSVAGDESYTLPDAGASPAFSTTGLPGENTKPGWLKRLSMPFTGDVNMSTSVQTPTQQVSVPSQVREGSAEP